MKVARILGLCLPFLFWITLADILNLTPTEFVPTFGSVYLALFTMYEDGLLEKDLIATIYRWLSGFLIGSIAGVSIGCLVGQSKILRELLSMPIEFLRAIPVTALLPLFLLVFGVGNPGKIAMAAFPSALMLIAYTEGGLRRCSRARLEMASSFGASSWQSFRHVSFPELIPSLLLGLRLALAFSLVVSVVAEMFIGTEYGLGQRVYEAYMLSTAERLYAYILLMGAMGYLSSLFIRKVETRSLFWVGK